MKKPKHTPAPFVAVEIKDGYLIKEAGLHKKGFSDVIAEVYYQYPKKQTKANALLFAAAPEVLAALQLACDQFIKNTNGVPVNPNHWYNKAIEAIKKATNI
jgi:hypothetical protein